MIVDNILRLANEHSFRKFGFIWKVGASSSGWNYFGSKMRVGWLGHSPPLSLALAKLKLGFWFQSLNWKSDLKFSCSGKGFAWDFRMEKGDYYVTFTDNSRSTKNECLVCRYFFEANTFCSKTFFAGRLFACVNFTALL